MQRQCLLSDGLALLLRELLPLASLSWACCIQRSLSLDLSACALRAAAALFREKVTMRTCERPAVGGEGPGLTSNGLLTTSDVAVGEPPRASGA